MFKEAIYSEEVDFLKSEYKIKTSCAEICAIDSSRLNKNQCFVIKQFLSNQSIPNSFKKKEKLQKQNKILKPCINSLDSFNNRLGLLLSKAEMFPAFKQQGKKQK